MIEPALLMILAPLSTTMPLKPRIVAIEGIIANFERGM
jgi:hypothetical protein